MDEKEERIFFLIYRENYFNPLCKVTMRSCEDLMTYNLFHPPTKELIKNLKMIESGTIVTIVIPFCKAHNIDVKR